MRFIGQCLQSSRWWSHGFLNGSKGTDTSHWLPLPQCMISAMRWQPFLIPLTKTRQSSNRRDIELACITHMWGRILCYSFLASCAVQLVQYPCTFCAIPTNSEHMPATVVVTSTWAFVKRTAVTIRSLYASTMTLKGRYLTHWGRDKMAAISQTTRSNAFCWMKMLEFRLIFHWSLFLRFQLTIFQHWFR